MVKCGEGLLTLCRRKKKIRPCIFPFQQDYYAFMNLAKAMLVCNGTFVPKLKATPGVLRHG